MRTVVQDMFKRQAIQIHTAGIIARSTLNMNEAQRQLFTVTDLQQVMSVVHSMYLLIEHNNEVMARVAMEIATSDRAKKILDWTDAWQADEERCEWFRRVVHQFLKTVTSTKRDDNELFGETDKKHVSQRQLDDAEEETQRAVSARKQAERDLAQANEAAEAEREKCKALEAALVELRRQIRKYDAAGNLAQKLMDSERELKEMRDMNSRREQELLITQRQLDQKTNALQKVQEISANREQKANENASRKEQKLIESNRTQEAKIKELQEKLKQAESQVKEAQECISQREKALGEAQKKLNTSMIQLEKHTQKTKNPDEVGTQSQKGTVALEHDKQSLQAEIEKMKKKLAAFQGGGKSSSAASEGAAKERGKDDELEDEIDNFDDVEDEDIKERLLRLQQKLKEKAEQIVEKDEIIAQLQAKLERRKGVSENLRADKQRLEEDLDKQSRLMQDMKAMVNKLQAIAEQKGYGKDVKEILDASGIADMVNSDKYNCFQRLYQDAKRRQNSEPKPDVVTRRGSFAMQGSSGAPAVNLVRTRPHGMSRTGTIESTEGDAEEAPFVRPGSSAGSSIMMRPGSAMMRPGSSARTMGPLDFRNPLAPMETHGRPGSSARTTTGVYDVRASLGPMEACGGLFGSGAGSRMSTSEDLMNLLTPRSIGAQLPMDTSPRLSRMSSAATYEDQRVPTAPERPGLMQVRNGMMPASRTPRPHLRATHRGAPSLTPMLTVGNVTPSGGMNSSALSLPMGIVPPRSNRLERPSTGAGDRTRDRRPMSMENDLRLQGSAF